MIKRTCLLIDDEKQDDIFPTIIEEGKKHSLEVTCYQFNVGNQERRDLLENEMISIPNVIKAFQKEFAGIKIDLIAFDWNLGEELKGPELIKQFNDHKIRRNVPKMLHSGILKLEIEKLCGDYRKDINMPFKSIWNQIDAILQTRIIAFAGKENYEIELIKQLRKIEDTFESSIEEELRKFPDFVFKPSFPNKHFKGKSFEEIAEIVDGNENLRNELTKEITQQVIAYLTESI